MSTLMEEMNQRAQKAGVPLSVQFDITYRCNERCVHCYLDHDDHGELTTAEIMEVLDQLAEAGTFFLCFSGGEVLMRMDFFRILEYARSLLFAVKVKTNAFMIREKEADRLCELGVESVQVSIYSHRPEVHDAITKLPGSLKRSVAGIRGGSRKISSMPSSKKVIIGPSHIETSESRNHCNKSRVSLFLNLALAQVWCRLVLHKSAIYQIPRSLLTFPQLRAER